MPSTYDSVNSNMLHTKHWTRSLSSLWTTNKRSRSSNKLVFFFNFGQLVKFSDILNFYICPWNTQLSSVKHLLSIALWSRYVVSLAHWQTDPRQPPFKKLSCHFLKNISSISLFSLVRNVIITAFGEKKNLLLKWNILLFKNVFLKSLIVTIHWKRWV